MNARIYAPALLSLLFVSAVIGQDAPAPTTPTPEAVAVPAPEAPPTQVPDIACDAPSFNFGSRIEGDVVDHTFTIRNDGTTTLVINNVRTTCGCTVANISKREIPPGDTADITANFNSRGKRGHQSKVITVECNDPDEAGFGLTLEGDINVPLTINPPHIFLSNIDQSAVVTARISIVSGKDPLKVFSVASDNPAFAVTLETVQQDQSYNVVVVTVPPLAPPMVEGTVKILTDNSSQPEQVVPVTISVQSVLNIAPRELSLVEQGGRPITRYIVVRPGVVADYKVTEVLTPVPEMAATITPVGGNGYQIRIENIIPSAALNGKSIVIKTTAPGMEEILIPINVAARNP